MPDFPDAREKSLDMLALRTRRAELGPRGSGRGSRCIVPKPASKSDRLRGHPHKALLEVESAIKADSSSFIGVIKKHEGGAETINKKSCRK
jgi:hypothetical protein